MRRTSAATSLAMLFTTVFVLGIGPGAQADEPRSVRMKFSGTNVATSINLRPNTVTDETHLTGDGSLGAFTFRELHADGASPQPPPGCSGPNFAVVAGAGVFTFEDGSIRRAHDVGNPHGRLAQCLQCASAPHEYGKDQGEDFRREALGLNKPWRGRPALWHAAATAGE